MDSVKASVIIPTKNPGKQFHVILDAVLAQKSPWPFEVLVIDSGSTDGTIEFCRHRSELIKLIEITPEEFGHGKTRNFAAFQSSGEFIVYLTHDALPKDEKWLFNLVSSVEESKDIAGAFGRHLPYPGGNPFNERDLNAHFDNFKIRPVVEIDDWERYESDISYKQYLHFFSNNNSCIRKSVLEKIPFPNVDFAEDQTWAMRVLEAGYSKAYADTAVVFHSHDYSPIELFMRSVDESRALARIFGYDLCPSLIHLVSQTIKTTARDLKYAFKDRTINKYPYWVTISPFLNLAKQLGFYVGKNFHQGDDSPLLNKISLDKALKAGVRKVKDKR